jgi:transglutaminase-like putative cysteine protease
VRIAIRHQLSLHPEPGTIHAVMQLLLTPPAGSTQKIESWHVEMAGIETAERFTDAFGNVAHLANQSRPEGPVTVTVNGVVNTTDTHGMIGKLAGDPVAALFKRRTPLTKGTPAHYRSFRGSKDSKVDQLHALMMRIRDAVGAAERAPKGQSQSQSQGGQSQMQTSGAPLEGEPIVPEDVLPPPPATDFAHAFVGAARALDIPCRFVTGYLEGADPAPTAFHAWAEAYDEALGWIGFDPMLGICPTHRHVRLAVGLDALGTQPIRCVPSAMGPHELLVEVNRLDEAAGGG